MPIVTEKKTTIKRKETVSKIKVANSEIVIGNIYETVSKKDLAAPQPKGDVGSTKLPMPGIGEQRSVVWDEDIRRWDTGFEVGSPCNRNMNPSEKEALVDVYNTHIREPYEKFYNVDVSATNDDFWQGNDAKEIKPYLYELGLRKSYDTTNPKDLFDLFHALKQGKLAEVGERDATIQRTAVYAIKNREQSSTAAELKILEKAEAIGKLGVLIDSLDPEKDDTLYTVLEWMNFPNIRGAEKEALRKVALKAFENEKTGRDSVERFLEAYSMTKSEHTKQEMEMFSILSKLKIKNKLEFKRQQFYLDGTLLGNTLKGAAKSALTNPELKGLILEVWEQIQ